MVESTNQQDEDAGEEEMFDDDDAWGEYGAEESPSYIP